MITRKKKHHDKVCEYFFSPARGFCFILFFKSNILIPTHTHRSINNLIWGQHRARSNRYGSTTLTDSRRDVGSVIVRILVLDTIYLSNILRDFMGQNLFDRVIVQIVCRARAMSVDNPKLHPNPMNTVHMR